MSSGLGKVIMLVPAVIVYLLSAAVGFLVAAAIEGFADGWEVERT